MGEFRVITAPVDAEFGRGMAQVQMISRSGTNEVHGSAFEFNRVTALSANSWFSNQLGRNADGSLVAPRSFLIRNQFGARVGAPIKKNRTFGFFLYEGQRQMTDTAQNVTVFTATARQGIFRFFPGVQNGNATSAVATVDCSGNPVAPAARHRPITNRQPVRARPQPPRGRPHRQRSQGSEGHPAAQQLPARRRPQHRRLLLAAARHQQLQPVRLPHRSHAHAEHAPRVLHAEVKV